MGPRPMLVTILCIGFVGLSLTATQAQGLTSAAGDITGQSDCAIPAHFVSAERITKGGERIPSSASSVKEAVKLWRTNLSEGLVVHYSAGGADVEQVIPPVGWSPAKADRAERALYGAIRPMDDAEASLTPAGPGRICATARGNSVTHTAVLNKWGGGINLKVVIPVTPFGSRS